MDERTKTRKARLRKLIDAAPYSGNQQAFATRVHLSRARITQFLDPDSPWGERSARGIARKLGFADDYFDGNAEPSSEAGPTVEERISAALEVLSNELLQADDDTRHTVGELLSAMAASPQTVKNKSRLILRLLVTDRDKSHKSTQDQLGQPHISVNLGHLDLGDENGRRDTDAAAGGRKN